MAKNVLLLNDPDNSLGEIQEAIQKAGYTAYMTDNSDDAIELFEKIEGKFCLLSLKAMGALDCLQIIQMFDDTVPIFFAGTVKKPLRTRRLPKSAEAMASSRCLSNRRRFWARLKRISVLVTRMPRCPICHKLLPKPHQSQNQRLQKNQKRTTRKYRARYSQ